MLNTPIKINSQSLCFLLKDANIATTNSISDFDNGKGWLYELGSYPLHHEIIIEGPCAFYGGTYSPNPWNGPGGLCTMGAYSYSHSALPESMVVGRHCSIAKGLRFLDFSHPVDWVSSSVAFFFPNKTKELSSIHHLIERSLSEPNNSFSRKPYDPCCSKAYPLIEHDVWIGENVTLALGITVGTGSIIASNSTVTKNVPPYSIIAGVPAKIKKYRFSTDVIEALLKLEWWRYNIIDFGSSDFTQPKLFIEALKAKIANDEIQPWSGDIIKLPNEIIS